MTENKRYLNIIPSGIQDTETGKIIHGSKIGDLLNEQDEQIKELEERNQRQYDSLKKISDLMYARDWKTLEQIVEGWEQTEKQLKREWSTYGDDSND